MTNRLDLLVERNLVRRRPDSEDGRVTRVQLTAAGRRRVDSAFTALIDVEAALLEALSRAEQTELARGLQAMLDRSHP